MSAMRSRDAQPTAVEALPIVLDQDTSFAEIIINNSESKTPPNISKETVGLDAVDDLTTALETLELHKNKRLLFRVVCKDSWGSAILGEDILPADTTTNPLEDPSFNWKGWLTNHGNRRGGESIGTSCTTDFLRALTIALQYRYYEKKDISIIVIQERFLVGGSCHAFNDLILWSKLPSHVFPNNLKKNEHIIVGPIPAHAIVSRITFDSLEAWDLLNLFPQLHFDTPRKVAEVRTSILSENGNFDPRSGDTRLFLVAILGHQFGVYPDDSATWQLLVHFQALANRHIYMHLTKRYESQLDSDTIKSLEGVARSIKTMQKQNKAIVLRDEERLKTEHIDVEGAIKGWAQRGVEKEEERKKNIKNLGSEKIEMIFDRREVLMIEDFSLEMGSSTTSERGFKDRPSFPGLNRFNYLRISRMLNQHHS